MADTEERDQAPLNLTESVVIKRGNLFLLARNDGSVPLGGGHPFGLYHDDGRYLSGHELRLDGAPLALLMAGDDAGAEIVHELLAGERLHVRLERAITGERELTERITVHNHGSEAVSLTLSLRLAADFRPMMAVRGMLDGWDPPGVSVHVPGPALEFRSSRGDALRVELPPGAAARADGRIEVPVRAQAGAAATVGFAYTVAGAGERDAAAPAVRRPAERATVETDQRLFDRILQRALLDLQVLDSQAFGHRYYAAGLPWYATLFGRDSLITADQTLALDPQAAEGTLRLLARLIGEREDVARDEQPGKILHEVRFGEVERIGSPFARYYGSVDATPLFLCLLGEHARWSGSLELFEALRPQVARALEWLRGAGDLDGDGLLEYARRAPGGLRNQGWKDSGDGVLDGGGRPLEPPIALVEAQAYAVRARRSVARLLDRAGEPAAAGDLVAEAQALEARLEAFWLEGHYAMALDGEKRASRALASNQGHLLWAEAVGRERASAVRDALMGPRMFSGWGIRTLAEGEAGYDPVGYHTGSVWPHDTAMIAIGLRRYGFDADFVRVFDGLLEAASRLDGYRLPELFAGYPREPYDRPLPYLVACRPQAWAAGALPALLTAGLGLAPDAFEDRLRVVRPVLPTWLERVTLRGLRVGRSRLDLRFERDGERAVLADVRVDGPVRVTVQTGASAGL